MSMSRVKILNIGRKRFNEALSIQSTISRTILDALKCGNEDRVENTLILVEHSPVYTVGLRSKQYTPDLVAKLSKVGAEFIVTDRGGLITFHGYGQLVAYPVLYLGSFGNKSIKWYIHRLEDTVIEMAKNIIKDKSVQISTICEYPGVWIDKERKLAAIGVNCRRYVTTHGVSINCNTDLSYFEHIIPCGIEGKKVTSFTSELQRNFTIEESIPFFLEAFKNTFKCNYV
ncbi:putative lipoyltransferase 2-like protein [Leptotrombidium deliense]|uniref:Octanoyl-[acyl-carrier-protein]:protein N-octanoyltransferase LIPT2, mitochondrial n=1 Tax=Leptotrombidium deliense TaxID=299467 RepID=A0A443SL80_9ACAR|nr:putative lipoyltransferase 2-like protein [Leptotrombidium deliense]